MREWIEDLHPRYIAVTKKELIRQLSLHGGGELILRTLAAGTAHPHFEERLTKACYRLQLLSSFVYLVHNKNRESCFRRRTAKLPVARYEALIFDGFIKNAASSTSWKKPTGLLTPIGLLQHMLCVLCADMNGKFSVSGSSIKP